jgi:hypothetical protein
VWLHWRLHKYEGAALVCEVSKSHFDNNRKEGDLNTPEKGCLKVSKSHFKAVFEYDTRKVSGKVGG